MRGIVQAGRRGPMDFPSIAEQTERPYISTGHLPEPELVQKLVSDAHRRFKSNGEGQNSQVYPALARVPRELFGICVVGTSGRVYEAGDTNYEFSIMSVSKPFVFALVCEMIGPEEARARLGANATGLPFNSLAAIEHGARPHQSDGECRRDRDHQPRAGPDGGRSMAIHSRRAVAVCGSQAPAQRRGLRLGVGDELSATAVSPGCCRATTASIATPGRRPISTPGSAR